MERNKRSEQVICCSEDITKVKNRAADDVGKVKGKLAISHAVIVVLTFLLVISAWQRAECESKHKDYYGLEKDAR